MLWLMAYLNNQLQHKMQENVVFVGNGILFRYFIRVAINPLRASNVLAIKLSFENDERKLLQAYANTNGAATLNSLTPRQRL